MTYSEKLSIVGDFCGTVSCENCPLNHKSLKWLKPSRYGVNRCLDISHSPERDLDIAIKIIENYRLANAESDDKNDVVNHPKHYTDGKIEVIEFIEDKKLGFCLGNAVKYIARAGKKDPTKEVEDLKKARWYIERRIKQIEEAK